MDELSLAYEGFLKSHLGNHLVSWIKEQQASKLNEAQRSVDPHEAFALTKTAYAFTIVLTHLETMAQGHKVKTKVVPPRQDGT